LWLLEELGTVGGGAESLVPLTRPPEKEMKGIGTMENNYRKSDEALFKGEWTRK